MKNAGGMGRPFVSGAVTTTAAMNTVHRSRLSNESYIALDCEMVGVGPGGYGHSCARVTVVDWNGTCLLDTFIVQKQEVTDYRTPISGIKPEDLVIGTDGEKNIANPKQRIMTLELCRSKVLQLLKQSPIIVGHGLQSDLKVLGLSNYPRWLLRDTANYGLFMRFHHRARGLCSRKLKDLCLEKLNKKIQVDGQPHDPYEDAVAALELYKSVHKQWETKLLSFYTKKAQWQTKHILAYHYC